MLPDKMEVETMTPTPDRKAALALFDKCKTTLLNGSVQSYLIPLQHVDKIRAALSEAPAPVGIEEVSPDKAFSSKVENAKSSEKTDYWEDNIMRNQYNRIADEALLKLLIHANKAGNPEHNSYMDELCKRVKTALDYGASVPVAPTQAPRDAEGVTLPTVTVQALKEMLCSRETLRWIENHLIASYPNGLRIVKDKA